MNDRYAMIVMCTDLQVVIIIIAFIITLQIELLDLRLPNVNRIKLFLAKLSGLSV
jgi:hypothetical protein